LFKALRKEKAAKAKSVENTKVPNLQDPLVEVHVLVLRRERWTCPPSKVVARTSRGEGYLVGVGDLLLVRRSLRLG